MRRLPALKPDRDRGTETGLRSERHKESESERERVGLRAMWQRSLLEEGLGRDTGEKREREKMTVCVRKPQSNKYWTSVCASKNCC